MSYEVVTIDNWQDLYADKENSKICKKCVHFNAENHTCKKLSKPGEYLVRTSPYADVCDNFVELEAKGDQK